jgi:hypothetical protein
MPKKPVGNEVTVRADMTQHLYDLMKGISEVESRPLSVQIRHMLKEVMEEYEKGYYILDDPVGGEFFRYYEPEAALNLVLPRPLVQKMGSMKRNKHFQMILGTTTRKRISTLLWSAYRLYWIRHLTEAEAYKTNTFLFYSDGRTVWTVPPGAPGLESVKIDPEMGMITRMKEIPV